MGTHHCDELLCRTEQFAIINSAGVIQRLSQNCAPRSRRWALLHRCYIRY
ncbi:hypothetical protein ACIHDR_43180 [Nocardia sp. NPDC052278]